MWIPNGVSTGRLISPGLIGAVKTVPNATESNWDSHLPRREKPAPFSENAVNRMMDYEWPGNIRELENLVKRYTIVGNEAQIIRELATHKPIVSSTTTAMLAAENASTNGSVKTTPSGKIIPKKIADLEKPSLLEIGRRAAMEAEQEVIEKVLRQTRWNRRQAAKIRKEWRSFGIGWRDVAEVGLGEIDDVVDAKHRALAFIADGTGAAAAEIGPRGK